MDLLTFAAVCTPISITGICREIEALGGSLEKTHTSLVEFSCELKTGYEFLLYSKVATRLTLVISRGQAEVIQTIKDHLLNIDWTEHLVPGQGVCVQCHFSKEHKTSLNTHRISKDFQSLIQANIAATNKPETNPTLTHGEPLRLSIFYHESEFIIGIDFSGASLHERGYRIKPVVASLKETLAASIIAEQPPETDIQWCIDPCCGAGTLLIEAAMQWAKLPAHLNRTEFACFNWKQHQADLFSTLQKTAREKFHAIQDKSWPKFIGYDADPYAIEAARINIKEAGLQSIIQVERRDWSQFDASVLNQWGKGYLITNPPYGKRLQTPESLIYFYQFMGIALSQLKNAEIILMSTHIECLDALRLNYEKQIRGFNGPSPLFVRYGLSSNSTLGAPSRRMTPCLVDLETDDTSDDLNYSTDLTNRLHKNYRKLKPWLDQPLTGRTHEFTGELTSEHRPLNAYRIYDADLPEFNMAVDCYEHCLLVQEYQAPKQIDPQKVKQRLKIALNTLSKVYKIPQHRIHLKQRQQQKGNHQYQRTQRKDSYYSINEWGARTLVNLSDFLDSGVFLDHRLLRLYFRNQLSDKRFLNLFSYTGTASLQAALGGAKTTTSVDLSPTYTLWAEKNFCLNGVGGPNHQLITADAFQWVQTDLKQYDVIFVDPPTFSNSKKTEDFSVQRQHLELIESCIKRLAPGGSLFFSCNFKKFQIDSSLLITHKGQEISHLTRSLDFNRDKSAQHRCWLFSKLENETMTL